MKVIKGNVICSHDKGYILQQHEKVYYADKRLNNKRLIFSLKRSGKKAFISRCGRLGERLIRSDIKAGAVFENTLFFSDFGICYEINLYSKKIVSKHVHRIGMRGPLIYCVISGIDGFDDQICYGEYFGNEQRELVKIWHKVKGTLQWEVALTFDAGLIRHIHGIYTDKWRNCVYILTGDHDRESAIWVARNNFKSVHRLIFGDQQARCCQMMVNKNGFLYCTDSEYEQNKLYDVIIHDINKFEYEKKFISNFDSSIIYGCSTDDVFYFATTVEPDKGGINSIEVKVYYVDVKEKKVRVIIKAVKDLLPMKLFQYGYARIVESADTIAIPFCGVKKYDGRIVIMDKTEFMGHRDNTSGGLR